MWPAARKFAASCKALCKGGVEKFFVCGGGGSQSSGKQHSLLFDPATKRWSDASCSGKSPMPLMKHTITEVAGCGVVFGGKGVNSGDVFQGLAVIDFETMGWSSPKLGGTVPEAR